MNSGVDYSITFPDTIFAFHQLKKFTQSQAVFLEGTLVLLVSWLLFCVLVRLGKLGDGRNIWFQIRWWIRRLDVCFSTKHWLVNWVSLALLLYIVFASKKLFFVLNLTCSLDIYELLYEWVHQPKNRIEEAKYVGQILGLC